jgi:glycogen debranching enzyme
MLPTLLALTVVMPAAEPLRGDARVTSAADVAERTFEMRSSIPLRDNRPEGGRFVFTEQAGDRTVATGNVMFDALFSLAVHEARLNSVSSIKDGAYGNGQPLALEAFQTGEFWTYVWTRDLAYSVDLGLASFDPARAVSSLLFKSSGPKPGVTGGFPNQIVQDTGSGGSYPISTDRVTWALGADAALRWLPDAERAAFFARAWPILRDTLEQDRHLVFDEKDGLYRGEQSFLDWREQTYPEWTKEHTLPIGLSKALSTNVLHALALRRGAEWAKRAGDAERAMQFARWAQELVGAINRAFWDEKTGLYSTYLLSEGAASVRAQRFDLLGTSLAILADAAPPERAQRILRTYPTGPNGPSVVWPQERDVPIYHNQAIWPFVTAYWVRAGRHAGQANVVEKGIASLFRQAAENLSHMENFDFVSGLALYQGPGIQGPVINSRRQLWSVAAYFAAVQEVFFGLETTWDGIRFQPFITPAMHAAYFPKRAAIELRALPYRGTRNDVTVRLPAAPAAGGGAYRVVAVRLNGRTVGAEPVAREALAAVNHWEIELGEPSAPSAPVPVADVRDHRALYAPAMPQWDDAGGAVRIKDGKLALHFRYAQNADVTLNVYRDGALVATGIRGSVWVDDASADFHDRVHDYVVEAVDPRTGLRSHLSAVRRHLVPAQLSTFPAARLEAQGGRRTADALVDWGARHDTVTLPLLRVEKDGRYALTVRYANGSGPINTGITCAVKRLEVVEAASGRVVAGGYALMPQLADWERWEDSSPLDATLRAGVDYRVVLREDDHSRNMSYLAHNARYTSWPGGGDAPYNFVRIAAFKLLRRE